jgi:hypothetical protein
MEALMVELSGMEGEERDPAGRRPGVLDAHRFG